tara:strand:+ start:194 stop:889 length:696 start_codon:yes stop_codon:yes gene_type:complete
MHNFKLNRELAQLAIHQRIELCSPILKRLRKIFGRYLFSTFLSKYLINPNEISKKYYNLMEKELLLIEKYFVHNSKVLSIGSGIGGVEVLLNKKFNTHISLIEKNYVSKKIKYGWDEKNQEAYNNINLLEKFLINNGVEKKNINLFDFDKDKLPNDKFDVIISLYSLDYHYDFEIYKDYLLKVLKPDSILILDTVRPGYFNEIFNKIDVIKEDVDTVHKSKRIACRNLKFK